MEFKKLFSKIILIPSLLAIFVFGAILWKFSPQANSSTPENFESSSQIEPIREISGKPDLQNLPELDTSKEDDAVIQQQLDRDREEQKQTKYLKTRLEQTNLELDQEKALAEISKLKIENGRDFSEPEMDGQKNLPEVRVEYIGGDSLKKEAILSIAGVSFQVKEKSYPMDNIQVLSISDSSVTLHFSAPVVLTKTIEYKPE